MEHNEDKNDDDDEMGDEASDHVSTESVSVSETYSIKSGLKETWDKTPCFNQTMYCSCNARPGPARHRENGRSIWYLNRCFW